MDYLDIRHHSGRGLCPRVFDVSPWRPPGDPLPLGRPGLRLRRPGRDGVLPLGARLRAAVHTGDLRGRGVFVQNARSVLERGKLQTVHKPARQSWEQSGTSFAGLVTVTAGWLAAGR
jgi:hypothetical protein